MNAQKTTAKPTFYDLYTAYKLTNDTLWDIASLSNVPKSVVDVMIVGTPVSRAHALEVLAALSEFSGHAWTLDNTNIPTLVGVCYD